MGQCGCGDFNSQFRFPGPDGKWYSVQVYPGCSYCSNPAGVIIYEHDEQDCRDWHVEDLPVLDTDNDEIGGFIPILDFDVFQERLKEAQCELDDPEYEVRMAIIDTFNKCRKRIKTKTNG